MANQVTLADQYPGYKVIFDRFDKNGNGTINSSEWGDAMKKMGQTVTEEDVQAMIKELDADGDAALDFSEFMKWVGQRSKKQMKDSKDDRVFEHTFTVFDKDNSGCISADELRQLMKIFGEEITDEEIDGMLKEADINGDGRVTYEEFVKMMKNKYRK